MRKRSSGFTLIECLICLAIVAATFVPFMTMVDQMWGAYYRSIRNADERTETERVAYRVKAVLASQERFKIEDDNKGAVWSTGELNWVNGDLLLRLPQGEQRLAQNVQHFSLHKRAGETYVTLVKHDPINGRNHRILLSLGDKNV